MDFQPPGYTCLNPLVRESIPEVKCQNTRYRVKGNGKRHLRTTTHGRGGKPLR
jgi:hypothetical protein